MSTGEIIYLFIGGPARSGTTAFVKLLNAHPRIAIGTERYKFVYHRKREDVGPHLFESDRFCNLDESETNIGQARLGNIEFLKTKVDRALVRGDKVPHIMRYQDLLMHKFGTCRFIVMHRDVYRICSSWNVRASNPNDRWAPTNDFRVAVDAINNEMGRALSLHLAEPERCLFVRYENIFGPNAPSSMSQILEWLKLPSHPRLMAVVEKNMAVAAKLTEKSLLEVRGQREFIEKRIEWPVIREIDRLAV